MPTTKRFYITDEAAKILRELKRRGLSMSEFVCRAIVALYQSEEVSK